MDHAFYMEALHMTMMIHTIIVLFFCGVGAVVSEKGNEIDPHSVTSCDSITIAHQRRVVNS